MTSWFHRRTAGATRSISTYLRYGGCGALAVLLVSCGTMPAVHDEATTGTSPPRFSLVVVIHGDGDYLYHDALGEARRADKDILARTQAVAERLPDAEVIIFHEIKRRHVLFLIPRHDGNAYHYRHGRMVAKRSYWRDQGESRYDAEAELYSQLAATQPRPPVRVFFYFGHELPEFNSAGYDASYSERRVTIDDLAEGVADIAGESGKFDLLVLATCFGGTPYTIGALAPYAHYIVASPDNLHLSYFDLEPLAQLGGAPAHETIATFAERFARNAFDRLISDVQTVASVVVYDVNDTVAYRTAVAEDYGRALTMANGMPASADRCDCADDSTFVRPGMSRGLTVLYRAPRFGRMKDDPRHSGWACWRIGEAGRGQNEIDAALRE